MRTYETLHAAAKAVARDRGTQNRVSRWLEYADKVLASGDVIPQTNGNGQVKRWIVLQGNEWWVVRHGRIDRDGVVSGPHASKRDAMLVSGYSTSRKIEASTYELATGLYVTQTRRLQHFGLSTPRASVGG